MNLNQKPLTYATKQKKYNTWWLWINCFAALIFIVSEVAALSSGRSHPLWVLLPVVMAAPAAYWLARKGRQTLGWILVLTGIGLQAVLTPVVRSGLGVPNAITTLALISGIGMAALPRKYLGRILISGLIASTVSILMDLFGSPTRQMAEFSQARWIFSLVALLAFTIFFVREFPSLGIRTKIVAGILSTGGLALAVLVFFALYQTRQISSALTKRLDTSVSQLAEEQLVNTAFIEANKANQSFEDIARQMTSLAQNWVSLRAQRGVLEQGSYWNANSRLTQLDGGQYGNPASDVSSVFVPAGKQLNDAFIADLNVSAYLDFYAPAVLKAQPSLLAVYAIDTKGITRYYPNINLASVLPPDFDATKRPYFSITSPLFNPKRVPRWTIPYVDATGGGLVVTVAAPVYDGDQFLGVVAGDMQLSKITQQISSIKIGDTGYAYLIDDAGRILSMPPAGYQMFGINPAEMNGEEFFKQTILGLGSVELQAVTKRMTAGGSGLLTVNVNGVDTYISFSPIKASGYSMALVVPVSELQTAIILADRQTQQQMRSAIQTAGVILLVSLVLAIFVSLGLGWIIARPIQQLTQVASQIAGGDLSVRAAIRASDEIGALADSFNTMTSRLRATLDGLEQRVEERTSELSSANERNERRAKQFETIAQVARTISSTTNLEVLLPQITAVISREFGFYHVGIFLLDVTKEYAVLSAANSDGGQIMLNRGHRLKVGETGIVGYVTGTGKPRVALDTGADTVFFNNPDLPNTRSEMTLPLRVGDQIIGALDVQSVEANAFSQEDISILSTLADQVSIAIQNALQLEQTRKALNEAEALAKQFAQTGWQQFTKNQNLVGIRHTGARTKLLYRKNGKDKVDTPWEPEQARSNKRGISLSIPIKLRGEVIGSVDVRSPDSRPWDEDELDIATAIIERAAIAMENARLLQESQRLASKEAKIGDVTAKISASINMRNVLQIAVEELGRALPGSEVVIQFQTNQSKNGKMTS